MLRKQFCGVFGIWVVFSLALPLVAMQDGQNRPLESEQRVRERTQLRPRPGPRDQWSLGVRVDYSDRLGALVTRVIPGSAAAREGFETGDRILTVAGFQVGMVDRQLYPLDRELNLRADRFGRVLLLAQNARNGRLLNLNVRLDPAGDGPEPPDPPDPVPEGKIVGRILLADGTPPPRSGEVIVQVVDASDRTGGLQPVAKQSLRMGEFPLTFEIDYPKERIDLGRKYALQAYVVVAGRQLLRNAKPCYVITQGHGRRVELTLQRR